MKISKSSLRLLKGIRVLLLLIFLISFSLGSWFLWARYYNPSRLSFSTPPPSVPQVETKNLTGISPARLRIPSLNIDLPVSESEITNGVWAVSTSGVSHLSQSVSPGLPGNSIFYGHNWARLLGRLKYIKPEDEILILDSAGRILTFRVTKITEVDPSDVSILDSSEASTLTLYTCTGFMDQKRLVVTGSL